MKLRVVFRLPAEKEFDNAIAWYDKEQPGLGMEFKTAMDAYLAAIAEDPLRFRKIRGNTRRAVVRRFPYVIYFEPERERVVVLAIWHAKRNPSVLVQRLGAG